MGLFQVAKFTEEQAREWFEKKRWPNGPVCPHCGSVNVTRMKGKSFRPGLIQCRDCKKQFTVTVKTPMHSTQIPLSKWAFAVSLWVACKNSISSVELARILEITQKSAWHMLHRIRRMAVQKRKEKLKGTVEADEVYLGDVKKSEKTGKRGRGTAKSTVFVAVERTEKVKPKPFTPINPYVGRGQIVVTPIKKSDSSHIMGQLLTHVDTNSDIHTDNYPGYARVGRVFKSHHTVRHNYIDKDGKRRREFVSKTGANNNTAESFNARIRRSTRGTYTHVSKKHLGKYCDEAAFRWNTRMLSDEERADELLKDIHDKRLRYKDLIST